MKKRLLLLLLLVLFLSSCGKEPISLIESQPFISPDEPPSDTVVSITVPKGYDVLDQYEPKLNPDGSATYILTHSQHDELLADIREETEVILCSFMKDNPCFISIEHDENYTSFTTETSNEELSFREAASMITLFYLGGGIMLMQETWMQLSI